MPTDPPPTFIKPRAILALIIAGACTTIALWWFNTPSIHGVADWLTNAGRITGLLAGYGLAMLLLLMARVPAIERGLGADRLARWHSMGGRYVVSLIAAHATLIIWGYSLLDHNTVVGETRILWTQYADVLMATVALGLFILIGVTSARAARKRLHYETWLHIHFYTYLATALAFSHQFSTGAEFISNRPARFFWTLMYLAVALALLWYRFLTPVIRFFQSGLRVSKIVPEGKGVISIWLTGNLSKLDPLPGQFFRWRFLTRDLWWAPNPYSLSAMPSGNFLRITVQDLGAHSRSLKSLKPGTRVLAEGPYGAMTSLHKKNDRVLLVAAGVGITPIRTLFQEMSKDLGSRVKLLYRASNKDDLLFTDEFKRLTTKTGSKIEYLVGHRNSTVDVTNPRILRRYASSLANTDVYICGPKQFMTQIRDAAVTLGANPSHIHFEDFSF